MMTPSIRTLRRPAVPAALALLLAAASALAAPTSVGIPGDYQTQAGCAGNWDPACAGTQLTYDANSDVWKGTFNVGAAGSYQYKAALNGSWTVNYGANAQPGGANIPFTLAAAGSVKFYYDDKTHWVTSDQNSVIATVPGDFQHLIGCSGDWDPACLRSWLEDVNGTGNHSLTVHLPPGSYQSKVALNEGWTTNYGAGGTANGANINFTVPSVPAAGSDVSFQYDANTHLLTILVGGIHGDLTQAKAHWLTRDTIAWDTSAWWAAPTDSNTQVQLFADPSGALTLTPQGVSGVAASQSITLTYDPTGLSAALKAKYPHLAHYSVFKVAAGDLSKVPGFLKGQLAVSATNSGQGVDATSLQLYGVLDDLYTYTGNLGITWNGGAPTLRVWAPTALSVTLHLYDSADPGTSSTTQPMTADGATGTYVVTGDASWKNKFYLYEVRVYVPSVGAVVTNLVTDPYSLSLSMNSLRSQIVDLNDPALKPDGWDTLQKPALDAPEDIALYELHVRDFSSWDPTVTPAHRGTYLAFTETGSNGMKHLARLARAGLTHVHLLPVFDIASVNEDRSTWQEPFGDLSTYPPDSTKQRQAVNAVADKDAFNWGYDPYHYTTPEGSYSTNPDGSTRILEFRQMVKALNDVGLRVVMDVVYNHTSDSGQSPKSVLDKIVPGYYYRLDASGNIEHNSCCQDTASEHAMFAKLMVDSVKTWATAYKIDGFRFDIMSFHMKSDMLQVRDTLAALTPDHDGVDGSRIYLYGEGWKFGDVVNRGVNATQANMAGTGIGTFNDRIRDGVRGGGPFSPKDVQGFATGLYLAPSGATDEGTPGDQFTQLLHEMDWIRLSDAGNLAGFSIVDANNTALLGSALDYNGQQAGYTQDPSEVINYVSAHDNEVLFDTLQEKLPVSTSMDDRVRVQNLAMATVMLGQGVPFFHAGDEILRSKSGDGNSYNSGDWFNKIDWSYQSNNWGVGLPNNGNDAELQPLLANPALMPDKAHILRALDNFEELLKIRQGSKLFRLRSADQINTAVKFYNTGIGQLPGLLVMGVFNPGFTDEPELAVVLINASPKAQLFTSKDLAGRGLQLHPVQKASTDPVVQTASYDATTGIFNIPARTTAVFITPKPGAVGGTGQVCGCAQANGSSLGALVLVLAGALWLQRRRASR